MFERRYDEANDRLFLVYYPITPGFNGNKWGVSDASLPINIHTAINKPVVISRKNANNPIHTKQAGLYIHPTPEEAASELGHYPNAQEYYNWQERYAVGRVRNVERRDKGYAFTLEITDPDSKQILKSDKYSKGIPGWTSPQILSNAGLYPDEEHSGIYHHWGISHIALVDIPAYGFEQAGVRAKCLGAEKECMILTKSASQENIGFCVKQATIDLIDSHSSHVESVSNPPHNLMSQNENSSPQPQAKTTGETVTYNPTPADNTAINKQIESTEPPTKPEEEGEKPGEGENPKANATIQGAKTLEEANAQIRQMSELLAETNKQLKAQQKELDRITLSEKRARLAFIIPRDLFKSDDAHMKAVEQAINEKVSESFLVEHWKTKRELMMLQQNSKRMTEEPIAVKSASSAAHEVPDFSSSQDQSVKTNIQKTLELQKMILEGGTT